MRRRTGRVCGRHCCAPERLRRRGRRRRATTHRQGLRRRPDAGFARCSAPLRRRTRSRTILRVSRHSFYRRRRHRGRGFSPRVRHRDAARSAAPGIDRARSRSGREVIVAHPHDRYRRHPRPLDYRRRWRKIPCPALGGPGCRAQRIAPLWIPPALSRPSLDRFHGGLLGGWLPDVCHRSCARRNVHRDCSRTIRACV